MRPYVLVVAQGLVVKRGKKIRILLFKQRFKQIFLVFEMPIQRAARNARLLGNRLQRSAGYAVAPKKLLMPHPANAGVFFALRFWFFAFGCSLWLVFKNFNQHSSMYGIIPRFIHP